MKKNFLTVVAVVATIAMTSCSQVPTSGPIFETEAPQIKGVWRGGIRPEPPHKGSRVPEIVSNFLLAMGQDDGDYSDAKRYLTKEASLTWRPNEQLLIYPEGKAWVGDENSAKISTAVTASLDSRGSYTAQNDQLDWDLKLVREDGEWRISNPPKGTILRMELFRNAFAMTTVYFWDQSFNTLVPDAFFLPHGQRNATRLVQEVLWGPSERLKSVVTTAVPKGLQLAKPEVRITSDLIAEISLSTQLGDMSDVDRTHLAAQLARTLAANQDLNLARCNSLRLLENGFPLDQEKEQIPLSKYETWSPTSFPAGPTAPLLFGIRDDRFITIVDNDGEPMVSTIEMNFPIQLRAVSDLAVDLRLEKFAFLEDRSRILSGKIKPGKPLTAIVEGMSPAQPNLLPPQFTRFNDLWTMSVVGDDTRLYRLVDGNLSEVPAPVLTGIKVKQFRISPDGIRVLVIGEKNNQQFFGFSLINRQTMTMESMVPVQIGSEANISSVSSIAWKTDTAILLLVDYKNDGSRQAITIDLSGYLKSRGKNGQSRIVSFPYQSSLLPITYDPNGIAQRPKFKDNGTSWTLYLEKITALAYPG